ncbi:chromate transporter [Candidatus Omnitrophota bacterium]
MILLNLFLAFLRVGLFAIGGAYSFLPLIEREVVERYNWLTKEEFLDILGVARVLPGAVSIKYATYTGYKIAGITGAIVANLGNLLPPVIVIVFFSALYFKYKELRLVKGAFDMIHLAVFSMIIAVSFRLVNIGQLIQFKNILIIVVSFILFVYTKIHPALIIIGAGILGAVLAR